VQITGSSPTEAEASADQGGGYGVNTIRAAVEFSNGRVVEHLPVQVDVKLAVAHQCGLARCQGSNLSAGVHAADNGFVGRAGRQCRLEYGVGSACPVAHRRIPVTAYDP
jgi:hypothetical protein